PFLRIPLSVAGTRLFEPLGRTLMRLITRLILSTFLFASLYATAVITDPLRPIALVDLPGVPGFDEVVFADVHLVFAHSRANTVDIVDPVKRRMVAQIKNIELPKGMAVDAQGGLLYIAAAGRNTINVVSTADWKVVGVIGLRNTPGKILYV